MKSSTNHYDPEIWWAAQWSYIIPTDKFIADCVKTIWETTTTSAVENSSNRR